jgi:hypothetical protein
MHATSSLEAFLNEEIEKTSRMQPTWNDSLAALERLEVHQKWMVVPRLLFGRTFERGAEPFQSFRTLFKLRNELVHYRPLTREAGFMPSFAAELRGRFKLSEPEPHPAFETVLTDWQNKVLNRECARWACVTARLMVLKWYELSGWEQGRKYADWEWSANLIDGNAADEPPSGVVSLQVGPELTVVDLAAAPSTKAGDGNEGSK